MNHTNLFRTAGQRFMAYPLMSIRRHDATSWLLRPSLAIAILIGLCNAAWTQDEGEPVLRLEADGPTSYVTSLAFSPDGQTLYAGSWDKTVYVWRWDAA